MTPEPEKYDAIVIGAGQSGGPLSRTLASSGMKTALIEREHVGGTCINTGCTPTKTMVASARIAYLASRAQDYGINIGDVSVDLKKVRQRKRDIVESWRNSGQKKIEGTDGVDLIFGEAKFVDPKKISIRLDKGTLRELTAEKIFINTGARPVIPTLPGLDSVPFLNSTSIMELAEVPEHLLVLGGGYIGLEFGQMFRRFGSEITIIQRRGQLLTREDEDIATEIQNILEAEGIEVLLNCEALSIEETSGISLKIKVQQLERKINGTHILVAVGRRPDSDRLNLAAAGIKTDQRGFIKVNEKLETSVPGIYAMGDVKGGPAFTHISYDDYRIIKSNLLEDGNRTTDDRLVPYVVFIDPQLGRVGLSEEEARGKGYNIKIAKMPMSYVARAIEIEETRGTIKLIVDGDNEQILGCAVLGIEGGELMAILQMAMIGEIPFAKIRDGIFAHPTLAESLNNLFKSIEN
jgi:pyruvate/2-oxoglutarate dehydrogenase complex dihydrolipoamide dehydrogenase (E3) component